MPSPFGKPGKNRSSFITRVFSNKEKSAAPSNVPPIVAKLQAKIIRLEQENLQLRQRIITETTLSDKQRISAMVADQVASKLRSLSSLSSRSADFLLKMKGEFESITKDMTEFQQKCLDEGALDPAILEFEIDPRLLLKKHYQDLSNVDESPMHNVSTPTRRRVNFSVIDDTVASSSSDSFRIGDEPERKCSVRSISPPELEKTRVIPKFVPSPSSSPRIKSAEKMSSIDTNGSTERRIKFIGIDEKRSNERQPKFISINVEEKENSDGKDFNVMETPTLPFNIVSKKRKAPVAAKKVAAKKNTPAVILETPTINTPMLVQIESRPRRNVAPTNLREPSLKHKVRR